MLGLDMVGQVTVKELKQRLDSQDFVLLDTLPADHFERVHLPGAVNACVFGVNFLDLVKAIAPDQEAEILLYGSSASTLDAQVAADKLIRNGYVNVTVVYGGLASWRGAGFPLEGHGADMADEPQTVLCLTDGRRKIVSAESVVSWKGRNANTSHFGTVGILGGEITVKDGEITGFVEVDMHAIANENLVGSDLQSVLEEHLKSEDFFHTERFGTASLQIVSGKPVKTPYLTAPNVDIKAMLELRGVRAELDFQATVTNDANEGLAIEAHFDIDRTNWNIVYGSTRYFEHLGMHKVFDGISIELRVHAQ